MNDAEPEGTKIETDAIPPGKVDPDMHGASGNVGLECLKKGGIEQFKEVVGVFFGHLFTGTLLFLIVLTFNGLLAGLVGFLPRMVSDPEFLTFARIIHRILLWSDGFLFVWWLLYSIIRTVRGLR